MTLSIQNCCPFLICHRIIAVTLVLVVLITGCASQNTPFDPTAYTASGVYVRFLRIEVAHKDVPAFEALMKRVVHAAESAGLSDNYDWLCYREQSNHYWILSFCDGLADFACPPGLGGFVEAIGNKESDVAGEQINKALAELDYSLIWEVVLQQSSPWSTVDEMTTRDHPKARIIERTIVANKEHEHSKAVVEWTNFWGINSYPLPIEGFVVHSGRSNAAWQVVFPKDWKSFQQQYDFASFVRTLDESTQTTFRQLEIALNSTVSDVKHYDGEFARQLSYGAE